MHPFMVKAGITGREDLREIVKYLLNGFGDMLMELNDEYPDMRFRVVDTRNSIEENEWLNEIHPTGEGFKKIADCIYNEGIKPAVGG